MLEEMALARIGQNNCPVVFVCHSLGGLLAKQIVVHAWRKHGSDQSAADRSKSLLQNMIGIFFYATPHSGSELAAFADKLLDRIPVVEKSRVVDYLKVLCKETALLNNAIERVHRREFKHWKFQVIGETHKTKLGPHIYKMVVPEASARLVGFRYMPVNADHSNVCKPETPNDTSFKMLEEFITDAVGTQLERGEILDLTLKHLYPASFCGA